MPICSLQEDVMIIDLSDVLLNTGKVKTYTVNPEFDSFSYKMGNYEVLHKNPVALETVSPEKNKVHINGYVSIELSIPCDRCLTPVPTKIEFPLDKEIYIGVELPEDADEQDFVDGHCIDVDRMLYIEILMNLPMKTLCKEDCKGICTVCGQNLNKGECGCDRFVPDPRMSAINDIFKNFGK